MSVSLIVPLTGRRWPGTNQGLATPVLAAAISRIRASTGFTHTGLGILAGVQWHTVSTWERGITEPTDRHLQAIARALNLDPVRMVADALATELAERPKN